MDELVVWETVERAAPRGEGQICSFFAFSLVSFVRGAHTPSFAHSTPPRMEDLLCSSIPAEGR
jgi:hypothetical protein